MVRDRTGDDDPYAVANRLSAVLERFLLYLRLLEGATTQTHYEVQGTATLVSRMGPVLYPISIGAFATKVKRPIKLGPEANGPVTGLAKLLEDAEIKREKMAWTSFDVALTKFNGSYREYKPYEHLVDLATALEATLASGEKENEGLSLRLRSRAAALLATEKDPGSVIFNDVSQLYALRSTLVHGGQIQEKELRKKVGRISTVPEEQAERMFGIALGHAVDRMRDLVRRALMARLCLAAEPDPVWPFSGFEGSVDAVLADDSARAKWRADWQGKLSRIGASRAGEKASRAADFLSSAGERS